MDGKVTQVVSEDAPEPMGPLAIMTTYANANLMHNMVKGRAVTAILHFLNKTTIVYYSKKQPAVERSTY